MISRKSIKKLTGEGRYHVTQPLGFLTEKIRDWEKELGLQLNPDFQRGHVWTKEQQIAFVEFIIRGGKTSAIQFNHPNWMNSFKGEFVVVDGLQRLTALLLFVDNKLPVFDGNYLKDFEDGDVMLRGMDIDIRINDLKTRKEVLQWYLEINSGGTPHTEEEIKRVETMLTQIK